MLYYIQNGPLIVYADVLLYKYFSMVNKVWLHANNHTKVYMEWTKLGKVIVHFSKIKIMWKILAFA